MWWAGSEGTKKAQSGPQHQMAPCHLGSAGRLGLVYFLHIKKLGPSPKKGPFKNDAKLTLLELKRVCRAARSCKNIIGWRIDVFPISKRSFVAILRLV